MSERYEPANFCEWWRQLSGDVAAVESVVNHVHLYDVFDHSDNELPDEVLEDLARVVAKCWKCALGDAYPSRSFEVRLSFGSEDYGPTVSFSSVP